MLAAVSSFSSSPVLFVFPQKFPQNFFRQLCKKDHVIISGEVYEDYMVISNYEMCKDQLRGGRKNNRPQRMVITKLEPQKLGLSRRVVQHVHDSNTTYTLHNNAADTRSPASCTSSTMYIVHECTMYIVHACTGPGEGLCVRQRP